MENYENNIEVNEENVVETELTPEEDYDYSALVEEDETSGIGPGAYVAGGLLAAGLGYGIYKAWPWLKKQVKSANEKREAKKDAKAIERVAKKNLIEEAKKAKAKELVAEQEKEDKKTETPEK